MEFGLVALWLVLYLALMAAGVPVALAIFPRLADRGVSVALPIALAVLWLVAYWVGQVSIAIALWVGLGAVVACAVAAVYLGDRDPVADLDRTIIAETAGVFTVAFLLVVAMRAVDPSVHPIAGEKFLDFGLLKSLLRAHSIAPEDMWFAGEPVEYYYGGHYLASLLTRLTGTQARYAYNLALAGFYGTLVTAAYGLAGSMAAHRGTPRRYGALLGAFFVGVASNLSTPGRFLLMVLPTGLATSVADFLSLQMTGLAQGIGSFNYWPASRIIPGTINEFPFFAWLNGDLHAHMMSTTFMLLVATVLFSYHVTPPRLRRRRRLLVFGALPPLAGLLAVFNTWSFPTVGGLAALTLWLAPTDATTLLPGGVADRLRAGASFGRRELRQVGVGFAGGAAVALVGMLWVLPFWFGTATGRSIVLFPERSSLGGLLVVHGLFLLVFVPYLLRFALPRIHGDRVWVAGLAIVLVGLVARAPVIALFGPLLAVAWALLRTAPLDTDEAEAATPAAADGGASSISSPDAGRWDVVPARVDAPGFETILFFGAACLVILVDLVYVKDLAGPGRMNTVFKTYMQVWVLFAVASGAALANLLATRRPSLALSSDRWRTGIEVFATVLLLSASLYGVLATVDHFQGDYPMSRTGDPTLDAKAFLPTQHPDEAPAIRWLDEQSGQPNIVTAAPGSYYWRPSEGEGASAPASLTGVPTVLGWGHESGYRGSAPYERRLADVRAIYTGSTATRARLLAAYNVTYVYVGPAERARYGSPTFEDVPGVSVLPASREWSAVTIYRVDQTRLGVNGTS